MSDITNNQMLNEIRTLLINSKTQLQQSVNTIMVQTYWNIGRVIVEDEQKGNDRAQYGKQQLKHISTILTKEFGKGFDTTNLRKMRQFYLTFPIQDSVSLKLSWTHYRALIRIENKEARQWYIEESIANSWSARALDRQISNLYYERLLSSKEKQAVENEAKENTKDM